MREFHSWISSFTFWFTLLLCVSPQSGNAQSVDEPSVANLEEELFQTARQNYDRGNFLEAAEGFKKVHQLTKLPRLLQNIGAAYGKAARDLRPPLPQRLDAARASLSYLDQFRSAAPELQTPELDAKRAEMAQLVSELTVRQKASLAASVGPEQKLHQRTWFRGLMIGLSLAVGASVVATAVLLSPKNPQPPDDAVQVHLSLTKSQPQIRF
jgi:hypothetical protein